MATELLIQNIERFIRKYYKNQLIRAGLLATGGVIVWFLLIALLEYLGRFNSSVRALLFFTGISGILAILGWTLARPVMGLFKIGKRLSYEEAATIIGRHFPDIRDELLNTLQLERLNRSTGTAKDLVHAAIEQRTRKLSPVPFHNAIDLRVNKKFIKYALIPLFIFGLVLFGEPEAITGSTARIVSFHKNFKPDAGFELFVENQELQALENEDFTLYVKSKGRITPEAVYLISGENTYRMEQTPDGFFAYTFRSPKNDQTFYLQADIYESDPMHLTVLPRPSILNMEMEIIFPEYLGMENIKVQNRGDIQVPEGSRIRWNIKTKKADRMLLRFQDTVVNIQAENHTFSWQRRIKNNQSYSLIPANNLSGMPDTQTYEIRVIPDQFPQIHVEEFRDSLIPGRVFFQGRAEDDYGLKRLAFRFAKGESENAPPTGSFQSLNLSLPMGTSPQQRFNHLLDVQNLELKAGETIWYYFELWDNDGVNGSKAGRTPLTAFRLPTQEELREMRKEGQASVRAGLEESLNEAKALQESLEELRREILESGQVKWEHKDKLQSILERQMQLEQQMDQVRMENQQNNVRDERLSQQEQEILDKQKKIEELLENIRSEELEKLLQEMEKAMERMDPKTLQEMMEKMQMSTEDLSKELDRTLELYKQLELEQNLRDIRDALDNLKQEQERLAEDKRMSSEEKARRQEELNRQFEHLMESLKEAEKKNEDLTSPMNLPDMQEMGREVQDEMKSAQDQLSKQNQQKAKSSQQKAADKMQQMSDQLGAALDGQEQQGEDMEALRQLLENLVRLSFEQEQLMQEVKTYHQNDPRVRDIARRQRKLLDDAKVVEDSLDALAKRVVEIEAMVSREMRNMRRDLQKAVTHLGDRQISLANQRQQGAMTSANNLALMLSEVLDQMRDQMQQQGMGKGTASCPKPGSSGSSMQDLIQRQMGLERRMQEIMEKMRQQQSQGKEREPGQKSGENPQQGSGGSSGDQGNMARDLAKLAAEQEQIRRELQEMMQQLNEQGRKAAGEIMKKMEENETDILNRRISAQTLRRQQEITRRMLESEKSMREQEQEERRQANENRRIFEIQDQKLEEYFRERKREQEWLRTVSPALKPYYKTKVSQYFNTY